MHGFANMRRKLSVVRTAETSPDETIMRERLNRSMRRRMTDELAALIERACLSGHAETAKGLWVVLRDLMAREANQRYPNGRYPEQSTLEALAVKIAAAAQNGPPKA